MPSSAPAEQRIDDFMNLADLIDLPRIDAFGAGVYLLTALSQFDLWLHRRDRTTHLWLSLSAIGALTVNLSGQVIRAMRLEVPLLAMVINMFGVALALIALFELVQAVNARRSGLLTRMLQTLSFLPPILVAMSGFMPLVPMSHVLSLGFLMWAMINAMRAGWHGDLEGRRLAVGLVILIVTLAYDVMSILHVLPRVEGTPVLGFTLLYLAAARALSLRYDRDYRELRALRAELEARVQRRTAELERANLQLDQLSRTDTLTLLPNRRSFIASADQAVSSQRQSLQPLAIVMIDLDHFKRINDESGHDAGDETLRRVAECLRDNQRESDVVARWGGEEFIALLPKTSRDDALRIAEQWRTAIGSLDIDIGNGPMRVSASLGIAINEPGSELAGTIACADRALYRAKQAGRNQIAG
jgi:diguanylate cyclase (GGDEF)-like protein